MMQSIRSFLNDQVGRRVLIGLILVALGSGVYGITSGATDFGSNLAAEFVGNAVSILVTLVIIDWFVDHRRRRAWADVHDLTLRAIAIHLGEIGGGVFRNFPGITFNATVEAFGRVHQEPVNQDTADAFPAFVRSLTRGPQPHGRDRSASDMVVTYYDDLEWDFRQIQDTLTPRLIQTPSNQQVVSSLIRFDQAHRTLRHAIIAHKQAVTQSAYQPLVALLEAAGDLYNVIYQQARH